MTSPGKCDPVNRYRVAVIGLGGMGQAHAEAVLAEEACEVARRTQCMNNFKQIGIAVQN